MAGLLRDESSGGKLGAVIADLVYSPQMQALARQGREDFLNTLWGAQLDREMGAPGEPTPQIVTQEIQALEVTDMNM